MDACPIAQKPDLGTDYLAVAYVEEAVELCDGTKPVFSSPTGSYVRGLHHRCIEPVIYSVDILRSFLAFAKANQQDHPIHLEFNTGLNRIGIDPDDLPKALEIRATLYKVHGLQSHLLLAKI
jgi:alanine racemase